MPTETLQVGFFLERDLFAIDIIIILFLKSAWHV